MKNQHWFTSEVIRKKILPLNYIIANQISLYFFSVKRKEVKK